MNLKNKRILSFTVALVFMFSLITFLPSNNVQAYSNKSIFNDVKVGLVSMSNITLTAILNGSYTLNGMQQPSGTILTIKAYNGLVNVNGISYSEVNLIPLSSSNLVTLTSGSLTYKYQGNFNFKVSSGKILPINSLDIESYLKGVVGYEMSDYFPLEALKAQAVAARNYALFKLGAEAAKGYDFDDTIMYQVYKGYDDKLQNVIRAVNETKFVVLLHSDRLIEALYSAWHGGYSEDAINVWGNPIIYLKSKADTFESDPWPNGNRTFTNAQMDSTLKSRGWLLSTDSFVNLDLSSITRFTSGRVGNINITYRDSTGVVKTKSVTKDKTRTFLGLPSNMYNVVYDSVTGAYTFSGKGNGHGLGMSQIGAKNRASSGQTYEQILKFYYDGSYLENLTPKALISSFTISSNEINVNSSIDLYTTGAGGSGQYMYKYQILRNGLEVMNTEFTEVPSLTYKATEAGSYEIVSYIKDKHSSLTFDEKKSNFLNVVSTNVSMITSLNQSATNGLIGQSINFKATAAENTLYKFELLKENVTLQTTDFSTSDSFVLTPEQSGLYTLKAYSKHPLSTSEYDDSKSVNFTIYNNPTLSSYTSNTTESIVGQPINFNALAQGGSGNYLYNFVVMKDLSKVSESGYTSSNNFSYVPSSTAKYQVYVYMRDNLSTSDNDMKVIEVNVTNLPVNMVTSINKTTTITGQTINVTSTSSGGSGSGYLYKYEVLMGGTVVTVKDFITDNNFAYTPSLNGSYLINVYMKDAQSLKPFDILRTVRFEAYAAPQILSASSTGKMFINNPVNIASSIKAGSPSGYTVRYQLYLNGVILEEKSLGYSTGFSFTPSKAGKYTVILYVKDNISGKSFDTSKTFTLTIESAPMVVSALPIKLGMTGPNVVTIQTGLKKLGYYPGVIDGIFGSGTDSAVKNFQRFAKLKATGVVDLTTFNAMNNSLLKVSPIKTILY